MSPTNQGPTSRSVGSTDEADKDVVNKEDTTNGQLEHDEESVGVSLGSSKGEETSRGTAD